MSLGLTRREFLKGTAATAAGAAVLSAGSLIAPVSAEAKEALPWPLSEELFEESLAEIEPIEAWDEELDYDIVIVGAGSTGVPAALYAAEHGARVAVLQKQAMVISQGTGGCGLVLEETDELGVKYFIDEHVKSCQYRADESLLRAWCTYSGEVEKMVFDHLNEAGFEGLNEKTFTFTYKDGAYKAVTRIIGYGPKPRDNGLGMQALGEIAEAAGAEFFYETPGVQLIKEDGKVVAVIGRDAEGRTIRFNASKGILLATGDYQNNNAMVERFCPDVRNFAKKQFQKTGDGILMGVMAGGALEDIGHTKMIHDADSGPMRNEPFLCVNDNGERFMNEEVIYEYRCNYLKRQPNPGRCTSVFDSNYFEQATEWGGKPSNLESLYNYIPGKLESPKGVFTALIDTHEADTLEELAEQLGIPAENLIASVERYNQLCEEGVDKDFGKDSKYMKKIDTPPFYGIHKNYRVSALLGGVLINDKAQVLSADGEVVEGLYAGGNCSGQFYGGVDYPLTVAGLSIGRCMTFGVIAMKSMLGEI